MGGAEASVGSRRRVGRHRRTQDRGDDRDDYERQHEELLAPFAVEEAPGPPDHGAAGRGPTVAGTHLGRTLEQDGAHRLGLGCSSVSGFGGVMVWSTTRPSRRNTTRSAQDASWASWVTTTAATPR